MLTSGRQVEVRVAKRVYQNPLFGFVGPDQIRRVAESHIHERFDEIISHAEIILSLYNNVPRKTTEATEK